MMGKYEMKFTKITIPNTINFADLQLAYGAAGQIEFNWTPLEAICTASNLDIALLREQQEDTIAGLIINWYIEHRRHGGDPDPTAENIAAEVIAEDARGGGFSYPPGRA